MTSNQPHGPGAGTVPVGQVRTLLTALSEAAESNGGQHSAGGREAGQ